MKRNLLFSIVVSLLFPIFASAQGVWTQKADYQGGARFDFIGYALNNKGYIGAGRHRGYFSYLSDLMEFDPVLNSWTQKASLPMPINGGTSFVAGNNGYVTCGANDRTYIYDTYQYDTLANVWLTKAFNYMPRQRATGVGVGDLGYIIGGYNGRGGPMNDCWEYDQLLDTWSQKESLPLTASRYYATGFSLNGKVYVFGGTAGINLLNDLWEFDTVNNTWTEKTALPGNGRKQAISFVINDEAYIIGGYNYSGYLTECWKYNATTDLWTRLDDFPALLKGPSGGVGFTINGLGYIVCGNGTSQCWEFTPDPIILKSGNLATSNFIPDRNLETTLSLFPNPASKYVSMRIPAGSIVKSSAIYDISGKVIQQDVQLGNAETAIDISRFRPGLYFLIVRTEDGSTLTGKFIKTAN